MVKIIVCYFNYVELQTTIGVEEDMPSGQTGRWS